MGGRDGPRVCRAVASAARVRCSGPSAQAVRTDVGKSSEHGGRGRSGALGARGARLMTECFVNRGERSFVCLPGGGIWVETGGQSASASCQ